MNKNQWALYNFLKDNFEEGVYISKEQIANAIPHYKDDCNRTRLCRKIETDVRAINNDDTIQKIIVSNKEGYKIANEKEALKYLERRFKRDLKSLKLNWKLSRKAALNGQMRLVFGSERDTIESFMDMVQ